MNRPALLCLVTVLTLSLSLDHAGHAQSAAQPDAYEHFVGDWVGNGAHYDHGIKKEDKIRITITEAKKKNAIRLDKTYGKKGDPNYGSDTEYLQLDPAGSRFALWHDHLSKNSWYKAKGLPEFVQSGFGQIIGSRKEPGDIPAPYNQFPCVRLTLALTENTFSYKWESGSDEDHMKFLSAWSLTRVSAAIPK